MDGGWRYRLLSVAGVAVLTVAAVGVANTEVVQAGFSMIPVIGHLPFDGSAGKEFAYEAGIAAVVVVSALFPLYKPRPRRILDIGLYAMKRVTVALLAMAAIGYFDYTYALPRATLLVSGVLVLMAVPAWFVVIRRRPHPEGERTIIVGDDPETMEDILTVVEGTVLGYVSPPSPYQEPGDQTVVPAELTDGGSPTQLDALPNLGGLSRLEDVLVEYDVGTAVLAFAQPDRAEFFGTLDTCYEHGVAAKAHRDHADVVLTTGTADGQLVDIELEPWDWLDHITKRIFDLTFAVTALIILSPLLLVIAAAIKLDSPGPVLYRQTRTAAFGNMFTVAKFRSMVTEAEMETGATLSEEDAGGTDPRVTRVGRVLRRTHFDEIPQLLAILRGEMSVVGPRPERPELDNEIEEGTEKWRRRWFVKPGLTGLAQINGITGFNPEKKLRHDIAYIRQQSFWFDLKILVRQLWMVGRDVVYAFRDDEK
ncbi:sugar transferase [Halosegnis marinus]|uniref:Sugar transferase n=1 Tax=Halosegnis marinus TaxID=3034023 RepID=A0ABD5ZQR2_9EURY|nr:sugar transferase [Halosegnis sp. DT85]